jgi:hypothetical protein
MYSIELRTLLLYYVYRYTYQLNTLNFLSILHRSGPTYSSYRVHEPGRKQAAKKIRGNKK